MKELWVVDNPRIIYFMLFNLSVRDLFCMLIITSWRYQWGSDLNFALKASKKVPIGGKAGIVIEPLSQESTKSNKTSRVGVT